MQEANGELLEIGDEVDVALRPDVHGRPGHVDPHGLPGRSASKELGNHHRHALDNPFGGDLMNVWLNAGSATIEVELEDIEVHVKLASTPPRWELVDSQTGVVLEVGELIAFS